VLQTDAHRSREAQTSWPARSPPAAHYDDEDEDEDEDEEEEDEEDEDEDEEDEDEDEDPDLLVTCCARILARKIEIGNHPTAVTKRVRGKYIMHIQ